MLSNVPRIRKYLYLLIGLWTICFIAVWLLINSNWKEEAQKHAAIEAQTVIDKDLSFRSWAATHGGVYVPPTEETPPNPYLDFLADRDIVTTEGKDLTLMNPAYMIRQVMQEYKSTFGINAHITSLKLINPVNAPDEWEISVLKKFEEKDLDVAEIFVESEGELLYRRMIPLITKQGCLKCHAKQGYKVGDIRGGLSVTLPVTKHYALGKSNVIKETIILAGIYLIGLIGLVVTARKNIKDRNELASYAESFRQFEKIVSCTKDYLSFVNRDYVYEAVNEAYLNAFYKSGDEIIGHSMADLLGQEYFDKYIKDNIARAFEGQEVNYSAVVNTPKLGEVFIDVTYYPYHDVSGDVTGIVISTHDITERRKAEEELQSIHHLSMDMLCKASATHFVKVSPVMEKVLGYTEEELLQIPFIELIHPDDVQPTKDIIEEKLSKGESAISFVNRYRCKDGSYRWFEWMSKPIEGGLMYGVARDITERKEAEEIIKSNESKLLKAQKISKLGFWDLNLITGELYWSDVIYSHLGFKPLEIVPNYEIFKDRLHPDDRDYAQKHVDAALNEDVPYNIDFRYLFATGEIRHVNAQGEVTRDETGEAIRFFGTQIDITERKHAEDKILNSLKEKEILLKEIHHRVKNNMAIISSLLRMQSAYVKDPKDVEMFRESQSRIRTMALVHEKLYQSEDFARIDVWDYIETLAQNIKSTFAGDTDIATLVEVEDVELDIDVLIPCGLIINEILTNAFKHAFNGHESPKINISLKKVDEEKVLLTIADNGAGLPEGFDINQTTGLGLKLVTALCTQLNGTLQYKSDNGAVFTLTFPKEIPVE